MSCSTFQEQMQWLLFDQRRGDIGDSDLAEHVAVCSECQAEWQRLQTLADAVRAWRADVPEIDVTDRVLAEFVQRRHAATSVIQPEMLLPGETHSQVGSHRHQARTSRQSLMASLAGLAALVVFVAVFDRPTPRPIQPRLVSVVAPDRNSQLLASNANPSPDVRTVVSGVGSAYLALVQDTAGVVNSATAMALPDGFRSPDGTTDAVPGMPWLEGVGRGWEPIQKSVGTMLDTFLKPAPADDPSQT